MPENGAAPQPPKRPVTERLRDLWPDLKTLLYPQRKALAVGLVLILLNRVSGLALPGSTKFLLDDVLGRQKYHWLLPLVGLVLAATALQAATSFALSQLLSKAAQRLIAGMRQKVQAHIGRLPLAYYDANKTGVLVARIMTDVEGRRNLVGTGLVELLGGLLTAAIALSVLLYLSPAMTLATLAIVGAFVLVLKKAFTTLRPIFKERSKINAEVTGRLTESLSGVRIVKGYHAEAREAAVFAAGVQRLLNNILKSISGVALVSLSARVLLGVAGAVVMLLGARQIIAQQMTLGEFVTFTVFLAFLVAPLFDVVSVGTQWTEALAGLERTREVLREQPEDEDPARLHPIGPISGHVVFDNVSFSYDGRRQVLRGISLEARPGTVTALVGPSGSGKSTTIGLIAAFYKPTQGRVLVDGQDLSTVQLAGYRTQLGLVLQDSFLFDGTIRENVLFGCPTAGEDSFLRACRIARVDEFAESFPQGYDTVVGERGVKLSGGQKQRISIARAILAEPRILILDEATSSLDSESEALIQQGLAYLLQGRTTFVIAHRLSTIRRADQILLMENGEILERGNHDQLYALRGRYFDLYTRQYGLQSNLFLAPGEGDSFEPTAPALAAARKTEKFSVLPRELL